MGKDWTGWLLYVFCPILLVFMGDKNGFMERCQEAFESASKMQNPLIVHHYDCDGITSGSIVASWFEANGKPFRMKTVRKVDAELIDSLKGEPRIIFVDLGSGSPALDELTGEVVVIDHHQPQCKKHLQANPHLFGFDGGSELSAAGCAYFVFHTGVDLGIVGAVGDIQTPLRSLNHLMLDEAVEQKQVAVSTDLRLFGRNSRPLTQLLTYADDPYLPGLTGNENACATLLSDLGIPLKTGEKWRTYSDLSQKEKTALVSSLADLLSARFSQRRQQGSQAKYTRLSAAPFSPSFQTHPNFPPC